MIHMVIIKFFKLWQKVAIFIVIFILINKFIGKKISIYILKKIKGDNE